MAEKYENSVKLVKNNTFELTKLHNFFEREIDQLKRDGEGNQVMKALDKFDKILMITLWVLELKKTIYESINKVKSGI